MPIAKKKPDTAKAGPRRAPKPKVRKGNPRFPDKHDFTKDQKDHIKKYFPKLKHDGSVHHKNFDIRLLVALNPGNINDVPTKPDADLRYDQMNLSVYLTAHLTLGELMGSDKYGVSASSIRILLPSIIDNITDTMTLAEATHFFGSMTKRDFVLKVLREIHAWLKPSDNKFRDITFRELCGNTDSEVDANIKAKLRAARTKLDGRMCLPWDWPGGPAKGNEWDEVPDFQVYHLFTIPKVTIVMRLNKKKDEAGIRRVKRGIPVNDPVQNSGARPKSNPGPNGWCCYPYGPPSGPQCDRKENYFCSTTTNGGCSTASQACP